VSSLVPALEPIRIDARGEEGVSMSTEDDRLKLRENVIGIAKELATPIDLAALVAEGTLAKRGARYEILQPDRVPKHAWQQATSMEISDRRLFVKFPRSHKRATRVYARLTSGRRPGVAMR
jgi:hypothetical protein